MSNIYTVSTETVSDRPLAELLEELLNESLVPEPHACTERTP